MEHTLIQQDAKEIWKTGISPCVPAHSKRINRYSHQSWTAPSQSTYGPSLHAHTPSVCTLWHPDETACRSDWPQCNREYPFHWCIACALCKGWAPSGTTWARGAVVGCSHMAGGEFSGGSSWRQRCATKAWPHVHSRWSYLVSILEKEETMAGRETKHTCIMDHTWTGRGVWL